MSDVIDIFQWNPNMGKSEMKRKGRHGMVLLKMSRGMIAFLVKNRWPMRRLGDCQTKRPSERNAVQTVVEERDFHTRLEINKGSEADDIFLKCILQMKSLSAGQLVCLPKYLLHPPNY